MENFSFPEEIQRACRLGDVTLLKKVISEDPSLLNQVDSKLKWSPLYRTVICGHLEATEYLLSMGADPNLQNNLGETPLHQAADNSQSKLVKLLLKHGANPNSQQNGDEKIVEILIQNQAKVDMQNYLFEKTALHYAVEYGHEEVIKVLVRAKANINIKDKTDTSPLEMASGPIKKLLQTLPMSPRSPVSETSLRNSPILLPSPEPVDNIPSIPLNSFAGLNLVQASPVKTFENYTEKQSYSISTIFEPDAEKSQLDIRPSKAFSFGGGDAKSLMNWLESVKLEFLYDNLMNAGYDDIEQMSAQMISGMPITEESLIKIGIEKYGHRMRLLAALDEESRPFKSSRRTNRAQQSNPLRCCMVAVPTNVGFVSAPELEKWLVSMELGYYVALFKEAGLDDLEHLLALMNTRWEITENVLLYEVGIKKQAHRYKILARLKSDANGFDTMKKAALTSRMRKEELIIEKNVNTTACDYCSVF